MTLAVAVKERACLFTVAMARAYRLKLKTQTRRTIKPQPFQRDPKPGFEDWCFVPRKNAGLYSWRLKDFPRALVGHCEYGQPGDRLVMLTTWATEKKYDKRAPRNLPKKARVWSYFEGDEKPAWCGRLRMGRFLPKRLRSTMPRATIKEIRAERCQEISEADAIAEGICKVTKDSKLFKFCVYHDGDLSKWPWQDMPRTARDAYARLRDEINGAGTWLKNEWVWVIVFEPVEASACST